MGALYTHGYPCAPNWSPAYSYGTKYGTGLYDPLSYVNTTAVPVNTYTSHTVVSSRVVVPPVITPPPVGIITPAPAYVSQVNLSPVVAPYPTSVAIPPAAVFPPITSVPPINSVYSSPPLVASIAPYNSVMSIPRISAVTPAVTAPILNNVLTPIGGMGFTSGGFNLFGDADPITPGAQSTPGIITATGPTRVF